MLTSLNKVLVYAQDSFADETAKTAIGFIRYGFCETVGIIDRRFANKTANDVLRFLPPIPFFASIDEAKSKRPYADVLLIGIAPAGGELPLKWLSEISKAIDLKLNVVNGLHDFLSDIQEIKQKAIENGVFIWDVRKTNSRFPVANARLLDYSIQVILTVGTDAAIGKMTVALEFTKLAGESGVEAKFIATGQTGIMISGEGIPVDAIKGDFMAGAIEEEIIKASKKGYKVAFVEGQGSILHPGWSGVTLALYHGSLPHKLILCHKVDRKYLKNTDVKIQSLKQFIDLYENNSLPLRQAKVVGIALNTSVLEEKDAKRAISSIEEEVRLPVVDVLRFPANKLLDVCLK